jgi:hypothetical protein
MKGIDLRTVTYLGVCAVKQVGAVGDGILFTFQKSYPIIELLLPVTRSYAAYYQCFRGP